MCCLSDIVTRCYLGVVCPDKICITVTWVIGLIWRIPQRLEPQRCGLNKQNSESPPPCLPHCVNTGAACHVTSLSWQRGDRRECARRRRLHRAEWLWGDQWQSDGAADHDQCLQDRLSLQGHGCHPLLSICAPRQEGQGGGEHNCLITSVMLPSIILVYTIVVQGHSYFCFHCICQVNRNYLIPD